MREATACSAPYLLTVRNNDITLRKFWVVMLSNGIQVYQDSKSGIPDAWKRLRQYCADYDVKVLGMAYVNADNLSLQINMPNNAEAYFHARKVQRLVAHGHGQFVESLGFGFRDGDNLNIYWLNDSDEISLEVRPFNKEDRFVINNV